MSDIGQQKQVWRINPKTGIPLDLGNHVLLAGGALRPVFGLIDYYDDIIWVDMDFRKTEHIAYETDRKKQAKYDSVKCQSCARLGSLVCGLINSVITCKHCNGKGYRLEAL